MNDPSPVCLLLCVDDSYLPQAGVAISSLFDQNPELVFHISLASFSQIRNKAAVIFKAALDRHPKSSIEYVELNNDILPEFVFSGRFNKSICIRFFVDRLVSGNVTQVLYIDADILVCGSIERLWETDLEGAVLAAVPDYFNCCLSDIGFSEGDAYYNSGVLLIDMIKWREEDCEARLLSYLAAHHPLPFPDQDALNVVLRNRIKPLGLEWNYQPKCADVPASCLKIDPAYHYILRASPVIIHFTTSLKPWNAAHRVHYSNKYISAANRAGLRRFFPTVFIRTPADLVAALKTKVRWHFPRTFRMFRRLLKPQADPMYRARPS